MADVAGAVVVELDPLGFFFSLVSEVLICVDGGFE